MPDSLYLKLPWVCCRVQAEHSVWLAWLGNSSPCAVLMTGEMISAKQAEQHGICSQVVPTELTVEYAVQLAAKIAKQAPLAIRVIKQSIKSIHETTLSQGLQV